MARKALTERARLEEEIRTCRRNRKAAQRAEREASDRREQLERERRGLLHDAAREAPGVEKRLAENAKARERAEADIREAREREIAAKEAAEGAERALDAHLMRHLATFIAEADKLTDQALADRQAVLDAIRRAEASEAKARAEWVVLRKAAQRAGKVDLGNIPDSPLARVAQLLAKAPRPEPRNVAASRKRRLGIPNLPQAVRDLFKGPEPEGDWTPIEAEQSSPVEVI
jgi:hypothetical protein